MRLIVCTTIGKSNKQQVQVQNFSPDHYIFRTRASNLLSVQPFRQIQLNIRKMTNGNYDIFQLSNGLTILEFITSFLVFIAYGIKRADIGHYRVFHEHPHLKWSIWICAIILFANLMLECVGLGKKLLRVIVFSLIFRILYIALLLIALFLLSTSTIPGKRFALAW